MKAVTNRDNFSWVGISMLGILTERLRSNEKRVGNISEWTKRDRITNRTPYQQQEERV